MSNKKATRESYGKALEELASENKNVVVLDAYDGSCSRSFNMWKDTLC